MNLKITLTLLIMVSGLTLRSQDSNLFKIADSLALAEPVINSSPDKKYLAKNLDYGMTIGIEKTPKGRIWACIVGGGDNADAFFILQWSDNKGKKWSKTKYVIDPHDNSLPLKRRTIVGQLWTDPSGRLWLFFDQAMTYYDGRSGNWFSICENPDDKTPVWSKPQFIWWGCTLNKPTVTSTGEWILPVSLWVRDRMDILLEKGQDKNPLYGTHPELDSLRKAHTFVSTDQGKTWERRGGVFFPKPSFDEHQYIELKDGTWWMTGRTGIGICQSFSKDKGYTWSEPELYQPHVNSRHFIRRLQSGNLLLIRHGMPDKATKKRSHLRAFISIDEGKTWIGGLLIDEREGVSYPTGFLDDDGYIYISYDYQRSKFGDIFMARFNEQDIMARKIVSPKGELLMPVYSPGKIKKREK